MVMFMSTLRDVCENEFQKAISKPGIKVEFIEKNSDYMKQIFRYLFVINYFKNRAETKSFFDTKFNIVYSLLLESIYALYSGQCRSALLLLRSAQEANFRHVLSKERDWIRSFNNEAKFTPLNFRFVETASNYRTDLGAYLNPEKYDMYYKVIDQSLTHYKHLCSVVHSLSTQQPVANVDYFSSVTGDTIIDEKKYFNLYLDTLDTILILIILLVRERFKAWDSYDLQNIFRSVYGKKRSLTMLKYVKSLG